MSIAKSYSALLIGLKSEIITIEVDISNGLHSFSIVGLGDRSIDEAKDRISASIKNSGYTSPKQKNQKVIISLSPADLRKEGSSFDLGMAITYLIACGDLIADTENVVFLGEISLEGKIKRINGLLPILTGLPNHGITTVFIPKENYREARLAKDLNIFPANCLKEVIEHLEYKKLIEKVIFDRFITENHNPISLDMSSIKGNETAKRALEIAGAGAHNVAIFGPPGTGKTLLAQTFQTILPDLTYEESIEVTSIHSIVSDYSQLHIRPPFRSPHHTSSYPAIVGGGAIPKPGEISLSHRGVLFLDEFSEFDQKVIESLRQPLEDRQITISRAKGTITYPAQCILIISMNPCPCGRPIGNDCICSKKSLDRYQRKISGPIKDRIDIWINADKVDYDKLGNNYKSESSHTIKERIKKARTIQKTRFSKINSNKHFNSEITSDEIDSLINISNNARIKLMDLAQKLNISARAFHRTMKVARTIADLENEDLVQERHMLEAIQYRSKNN